MDFTRHLKKKSKLGAGKPSNLALSWGIQEYDALYNCPMKTSHIFSMKNKKINIPSP